MTNIVVEVEIVVVEMVVGCIRILELNRQVQLE